MKSIKTSWLFWLAVVAVFAATPGTAAAYTVNGHVECVDSGWVPYGAVAQVFEVDPVPGGSYAVDASPLATAGLDASGDFTVTFTWPPGGAGFEIGGPDLIFLFTQNVGGSIETIYEESPTEAHWNVTDAATLAFRTTSELAVCSNPSIDLGSIPNDKLFLFTRVGNCETAEIDCRGSDVTSEGYYRPRKAPFSFTGTDTDQPFGATLDLFGWFGKLCTIDYYKVQYSTDAGASWTDVETSLPNKWYDTSDPNPLNWHWVSQSMGPFSDGGLDNLYQIPFLVRPNTPWSYLDRVARFNTTLTGDGLGRVKIIGYKWSGGSLVTVTSADLLIDPNYGEIVLQIDNTAPTVQILEVELNGVSKPVCEILNLGSGASDEISVSVRAWDQQGHLRNYVLDAMYGHDCYVKPRPIAPDKAADNYNNNATASPLWQGNLSYTTEYVGSAYGSGGASPMTDCSFMSYGDMPTDVMPTCAYQFRLRVSKRTTNGYGLIYHGVEDTWHVTIQR